MTEFLNVSSGMVESCKIPIVADCDTGFGGPSNVSHMIKKYESAGIAAVSIEDKTFPKQNSLLEDSTQELLSEKDFVAKIIAAKNARSDPNFLIFARTEALIAGKGMDEAIKRANAYGEAGADAIIIHSMFYRKLIMCSICYTYMYMLSNVLFMFTIFYIILQKNTLFYNILEYFTVF